MGFTKIVYDGRTGYIGNDEDYYYSFSSNYHEGCFKELKLSISHRVIKDNFEELMEFLHNLLKQYKESE